MLHERILHGNAVAHTPFPFQSAAEALDICEAERPILGLLGDAKLDGHLGAALNSLGIVEVYGPGGAGKSALGMQMLANYLNLRKERCACYFHSGRLSLKRMEQIFSERFGAEASSMLERVIFQQMGDIDSQAACISPVYLSDMFESARFPVQFILVDSISANFRMHSADRLSAFLVNSMAAALHDFSYRHSAFVFCINEVSAVIASDSPEYPPSQSASPVASQHAADGREQFKPVLALSWSNAVNTRIEMSMRERADVSEFVGPERSIRVHRCPDCPPCDVRCRLSDRGVESLTDDIADAAGVLPAWERP